MLKHVLEFQLELMSAVSEELYDKSGHKETSGSKTISL
jgi:hypothetical protein